MKHLIVGPANHGVTAYALQLAQHTGADVIREEALTDAVLPDEPIHVTFTDHLFGGVDPLLERVGARPLSVSFHDIPQPEEGAERFERRAAMYRRLFERAELAVTNSQHEAAFFGGGEVIRLPIPVIASAFDPEPGTVGVLGYLYPGKGHEDVVAALPKKRLRFLGAVSAGHEEWAAALADAAPDVEITGWLDDAALAREMGRIEVPICPHRHFSASGSLMTWLGAGRNVLATDSDYTREIDAWLPGRITRVSGSWADAVEAFTPWQMDPPVYGWDEVASAWEDGWNFAGLA